ncbi:MAG: NAD(P)-dependent glycerol-3-phosphate dehydrogenase [Actinobacteria bacterium]|nr:NAD(P)-dependent glycerol-3-phosphate dehydrogenase [Actinomycetota bacterium]
MSRVAVMGAGSWGTAFAMVLADAGGDVLMWSREEEVARQINNDHVNERYHPGIRLPSGLRATTDEREALDGAPLVVLAVPAQSLRDNLARWRDDLAPGSVLVSLMKGIEIGTTLRMSQVIEEVAALPPARVAVVSGPNLAREIALRQPAATTVACSDRESAQRLQDACTTDYFRAYWTTDVVGVEVGGSVKNVIALANGMASGLGFGENSQAALITRGLAEMARLGTALGADPLTFMGLAGVGDLIATCQSPLSRNRTFGVNLGSGLTVDETVAATKQTCEGVKSCQSILDLATRHGVDMPITEQVVQVVHHGMKPKEMLTAFMSRAPKPETRLG